MSKLKQDIKRYMDIQREIDKLYLILPEPKEGIYDDLIRARLGKAWYEHRDLENTIETYVIQRVENLTTKDTDSYLWEWDIDCNFNILVVVDVYSRDRYSVCLQELTDNLYEDGYGEMDYEDIQSLARNSAFRRNEVILEVA